MNVHCAVCVNLSTTKGGPPALTDDEIHVVHHEHWTYICCAVHAGIVREHGIQQAVALLKHANPTRHAT